MNEPIHEKNIAVMDIGSASICCNRARDAWIDKKWNDSTMWITKAISYLESARSKIYDHQESLKEKAESNQASSASA